VGSRYIELLEQVQASKNEFAPGAMAVGA